MTTARTSVVKSDRPHTRRGDGLLIQSDLLPIETYRLCDVRGQALYLLLSLTVQFLAYLLVRLFYSRLDAVDVSRERETSVIASEHPEVASPDGLLSLRRKLHKGDLIDVEPLDRRADGFFVGGIEIVTRVFYPRRIHGELDGFLVCAVVHGIFNERLAEAVDPVLVDGPVVELAPDCSVRRVDDVHLQVSEDRGLLDATKPCELDSEEEAILYAFKQGDVLL